MPASDWKFDDLSGDVRKGIEHALGQDGRKWFVDAKIGSDSNGGQLPNAPLGTMSAALALLRSGDKIFVRGKVAEQLATPAGVFDCSIIGMGNRPRHADDHTEADGKRGSTGATWTAPASGSTAIPLLQINQQGWRVQGLTWQIAGSATACVLLHKTDDSGDDERDGAHAELSYCKFQGNPTTPIDIGIQTNGIGFWKVEDSLFLGLVTAIAKTGAQGGQVGWGEINRNRFSDNTNGIVSPLYRFTLRGNVFMPAHTLEFDLTGGAGNVWDDNIFSGNDAFETNIAGTDDFIVGKNYATDSASGDVTAGVVTTAPDGS